MDDRLINYSAHIEKQRSMLSVARCGCDECIKIDQHFHVNNEINNSMGAYGILNRR